MMFPDYFLPQQALYYLAGLSIDSVAVFEQRIEALGIGSQCAKFLDCNWDTAATNQLRLPRCRILRRVEISCFSAAFHQCICGCRMRQTGEFAS
jgi:hypothetical protein